MNFLKLLCERKDSEKSLRMQKEFIGATTVHGDCRSRGYSTVKLRSIARSEMRLS